MDLKSCDDNVVLVFSSFVAETRSGVGDVDVGVVFYDGVDGEYAFSSFWSPMFVSGKH